MEIVLEYDIEIEEWILNEVEDYNEIFTKKLVHQFGISPQDPSEPDCCYFNVGIVKTIENSKSGIIFSLKTNSSFKVRNNNKLPTIEFFFDLLDSGTFEFAKIFNQKKQNTIASNIEIPIPELEDFREEIQNTIIFWDRNIRNTGLN